ncbi:MAG TPA: quinone-dependent dihydroorotate dehydrogenase [Rhizomicrobium sp.]|jgi:dihydroorotate dehydrogenase|nr:quinone-dependent dihydroorotate dehydrogenase [Rhizomicrobium sp.]
MFTNIATAALRSLPAEAAHRATIALLKAGGNLLPAAPPDDAMLAIPLFRRLFPNPLGLAAGFDKNAEVPDVMLKLGFGFVECGTVTPRPQPGNPQPRMFRLRQDRAVINRLGFNNQGMEAAAERLSARPRQGIVGINIGANKDSPDRISDYRETFARLSPLADYVTVNISSPNTPGLRGLQNKDELEKLLALLTEERARANSTVPLLLKIAPDLDEHALDDIAATVLASGIEGMIVSNTTLARPASLKSVNAKESGGLSGAPLFAPSTAILKAVRQRVGDRMALIGVGGVSSGADAYAKIRAGASLVQLYTAMAYEGPGIVPRIKRELSTLLARDGFARVSDAIGTDADSKPSP